MKKRAMIILADGFEEIEAITPIDILRRAEVEVVIAGLGGMVRTGSHGIAVKADILFDDCKGEHPDAIILPGGSPGAEHLASSVKVKDMVLHMHSKRKLIAAICASPALVLAPIGILAGKIATCFPGLEKLFSSDIKFVKDEVVQSDNIITSRGAGTSAGFGFKIAENLVGKAKADMVAKQMLFA